MNPRGTAFAHLVAKKRLRDPGSRLLRAILGVSKRTAIEAPSLPPPSLPASSTPAPTHGTDAASPGETVGKDGRQSGSLSFKYLVAADAHGALKAMKSRLARISRPVTKAELVHAGIDLLASLSDDELLAALDSAARAKDGAGSPESWTEPGARSSRGR